MPHSITSHSLICVTMSVVKWGEHSLSEGEGIRKESPLATAAGSRQEWSPRFFICIPGLWLP